MCSKLPVCSSFAPDPTGKAYSTIRSWIKGGLLLRGGEKQGRKGEGRETINVAKMHVSVRACVITMSPSTIIYINAKKLSANKSKNICKNCK